MLIFHGLIDRQVIVMVYGLIDRQVIVMVYGTLVHMLMYVLSNLMQLKANDHAVPYTY